MGGFVASTTDVIHYAESRQTSERASRLLSNEIFIATNRHSVAFGTAVRPILLGIVASEMCTVSYN
jgi:uncharacterized protein (DUF2062 family)